MPGTPLPRCGSYCLASRRLLQTEGLSCDKNYEAVDLPALHTWRLATQEATMVVSTTTITAAYKVRAAAAAAGITVFQDEPLRALVSAAEEGNRAAVRGLAAGLLAGLPTTMYGMDDGFRWLGVAIEGRHLRELRMSLVALEYAG